MDATKQQTNAVICIFLSLHNSDMDFAKNKAIQSHIGIHIGRIDGLSTTIPRIGFVIYSFIEKGISMFWKSQIQYPSKLKNSTGISKRLAVFFIAGHHFPLRYNHLL